MEFCFEMRTYSTSAAGDEKSFWLWNELHTDEMGYLFRFVKSVVPMDRELSSCPTEGSE